MIKMRETASPRHKGRGFTPSEIFCITKKYCLFLFLFYFTAGFSLAKKRIQPLGTYRCLIRNFHNCTPLFFYKKNAGKRLIFPRRKPCGLLNIYRYPVINKSDI